MFHDTDKEKVSIQVYTTANTSIHVEPNIQLIYVLKGSVDVCVDEMKVNLEGEDIYVINANKAYQLFVSEDVLYVQFTIAYGLISNVLNRKDFMFWCDSTTSTSEHEMKQLRELLHKLLHHYIHEQEEIANFHHIALCYHLIDYLVMHFLAQTLERNASNEEHKFMERMDAINQYIGENYNKTISLQELSDRLYLSNAYLSRFIKKNFGMNFARYVNSIRLYHAFNDVVSTNDSITKIAFENGFASLHAFNKAFKEEYQETPSQYRSHRKQTQTKTSTKTLDKKTTKLLDRYLSKQIVKETKEDTSLMDSITCEMKSKAVMDTYYMDMINIGSAEDLLRSEVQEHILELKEHLGFRYIRFWRPFSRKLFIDVYLQEGEFNFSRLDSILDFLVEHDMKPHMELGFKPKRIHKNVESALLYLDYETKYIEPKQWGRLMEAFILHLNKRYGRNEVNTWRFELWFNEWENDRDGAITQYFDLFDATYEHVRKHSEFISIGGCSLSLGYTTQNMHKDFLRMWSERAYQPDYISVMSFAYVQGIENKEIYSKRNTDMSSLLHGLQKLKEDMKECGFEHTDIFVSEWNLTISDRNHINDTCFKAAYIIKNMIEIYGEVKGIGYFSGSDYLSEYYDSHTILYGGTGLLSKHTIFKPSAYAYSFLHKQYTNFIDKGKHYIVSGDGHTSYAIVCHNMKELNHNYYYTKEDRLDREHLWKYYENQEDLQLHFNLQDVKDGEYQIKIHRVNRHYGSVLDMWEELGFHTNLSNNDIHYLKDHSSPKLTIHRSVTSDACLSFDVTLEANEIMLLRISKL